MANNSTDVEIPFRNVERINIVLCILLDFPNNLTECSQENQTKCVSCVTRSTYFTGAKIEDYSSFALYYTYVIWITCIPISVFGILGNSLIIKVLKSRKTYKPFDFLLLVLAVWDMLGSVMSVAASTSAIAFYGNWFGRGQGTMYFHVLSIFASVFTRTGSSVMTIVISIERYLVITFPLKAKVWFTTRNTRAIALGAFLFILFLNYPRIPINFSVEPNTFRDVPSLKSLEYFMKPTNRQIMWYPTMLTMHNLVDFWMPYPIVLLFNLLSVWKMRQLSRRRQDLNANDKQNIGAMKMFLPVVVVYFLTNVVQIISYACYYFWKTVSRELYILTFSSNAVNSLVNMPIYYYRSKAFKSEARAIMEKLKERWRFNRTL